MENFWKRVGSAETIMNELKHEREILIEESNYLRQCLKNYISQEEFVLKKKSEISY